MNCLVVNCSAPHYSLGAAKLANYLRRQGHDVTEAKGDPGMFSLGFDLVALSVVFSWTEQLGRDFARYWNRRIWRTVPISEYSNRQGEAPPFARMGLEATA